MKILSTILATAVLLTFSCTKKASEAPVNDPLDTTAVLLYRGGFSNGPYGTTSGFARIYQVSGKWQLRLDSFMVSNGPDLKVYLSKQQPPVSFISLGDLKSTNGNQTYDITGMPDLMEFRYALIHCEQYNHLFGYALLEKQ